jgi:hypothetical protein
MSFTDFEQHKIGPNDEIILAPVALVIAIETNVLACDHFFLPGLRKRIGTPINIMDMTILSEVDQEHIDLRSKISNHSKWEKLSYILLDMRTRIHLITSTSECSKRLMENTI